MLKKTIILLFLMTVQGLFSQTFKNDKESFIKDFTKIIKQSTNENLDKIIENEISATIRSNSFTDQHFQRMISTSNEMIEKRLKVYPEVYQYVFSYSSLINEQKDNENIEAWHENIDQLLKSRNTRKFSDFLVLAHDFFKERTIALNPNFKWFYEGGTYNFKYDKDLMIEFSEGDLICRTLNKSSNRISVPYTDSIIINQTKGLYNLNGERWQGKNGKVDWVKVGLAKNDVFANLKNYEISLRSTSYTCDTVILKYPLFEEPVMGKLIDRAQRGSAQKENELPFPSFQSFERKYTISNIMPNVDYFGGFSLQGNEFIGEGTNIEPAKLTIKKNGVPFIITRSKQVKMNEKQVYTYDASLNIKLKKDSITHPKINLVVFKDNERVEITRGNTGLSQSPFVNSYHKLDMYVEQINWSKGEEKIDLTYNFSTSQQQRKARFESVNYYDDKLFQKLQGMESNHPLTALWQFAYKYDEYILEEGKAATALGRSITQAKPTLLELSTYGFITYDTERGIVTINKKLENFVKARAGKSDYDNITFSSDLTPRSLDGYSAEEIQSNENLQAEQERLIKISKERSRYKNFGEIDLIELKMTVKAIDLIPISDKKQTIIFPEDYIVKIYNNREFHFKGWINAGKWEIHLENGFYDYNNNHFEIFESDHALMRANPFLPEHGNTQIPVQSSISGIKGILYVDAKDNRSGNDRTKLDFPKLSSKEKTRVYYNQKNLFQGAYEKERFYFEIEPFELDSLMTFNEKYLRLPGSLMSAGIFPKFKEELKIMPDYSLGFVRNAPENGFPFYGTEASYNNKIVLSNNGLQGSGQIEFISSTSQSNAFTFLPDSTVGFAKFQNMAVAEGIEFPDVDGPDAFITFLPKSRVLKARANKELLTMFNGDVKLKGEVTLKDKGMTGKGIMQLDGAELASTNFKFNRWQSDADTARFNLVNKYKNEADLNEDAFAFKTNNVTAKVDFKDRMGEFTSNEGTSKVEFPVNKYLCMMDKFIWNMDEDEVELTKTEDPEANDISIESGLNSVKPNFYSTHAKQDSLQFLAPVAKFSLKDKAIYCSKIEFIEIADARIAPDSGNVIIRRNAKIDKLENAYIIANYITKYHKVEEAEVEIFARNNYKASGKYPYFDRDSNVRFIDLPNISLDTTFQTVAKGKVSLADSFKLSNEFDFYGNVTLAAAKPFLIFDGATRINHQCKDFSKNWMAFSAPIDPTNIQIPVTEKMTDLNGNVLSAGILWRHADDMDSVRMYPTFLSSVIDDNDPIVLSANGFLQYNAKFNEFQIASKEKLENRNESGNFISLHTTSCSLSGDGVIDLGMDYGNFNVDAVGTLNYNQEDQRTDMNLTLRIRASVEDKIFAQIGKNINNLPALKYLDFNTSTMEKALVAWTDRSTADNIKAEFTLDNKLKRVPKELQDAIIITDLKLTSYKEFGDQQVGLKTYKEQAAVFNTFSEPVLKYIPIKIFAEQRTAFGDRFGLLLDLPGGHNYFFDYDNRKSGVLTILTSDMVFDNDIMDLKADKRKDRKFMYETTQSTINKSQFLRIFN